MESASEEAITEGIYRDREQAEAEERYQEQLEAERLDQVVDGEPDTRLKFTHHDPALLAASENYEAGWQHWRKKEPVRAMMIGEPFVVDTLHGEQECEAGDYLVVNPADGDAWGVKRQQFEASHERIG
jgi:hypothetical protein